MGASRSTPLTARQADLKQCRCCGLLLHIHDKSPCRRCGMLVHSRAHHSLQRTWAYLLVGLLAYIPANITPVMSTSSFMGDTEDTIISGVIVLAAAGSYFVAIVVFVASICIPVSKFLIIAGLALSIQFAWDLSKKTRQRLHTLIEFIGRWSMIDVFVVAVLAALIQLGAVMSIQPGIGIHAFALSVVFTMLAASSLDPRLLWDQVSGDEGKEVKP